MGILKYPFHRPLRLTHMLAAVAFASIVCSQTPYPPDVDLPKGWQITYWKETGYGRGGMFSPDGFEIGFPDYNPTGQVAEVQYEMDVKSYYFSAVIARTPVRAAIAKDGTLAISFPNDPDTGFVANRYAFDFWSLPKSPRQVAQAILFPLTRLNKHKAKPGDDSALKLRNKPTKDDPFALLQATWSRRGASVTKSSYSVGSASAMLAEAAPSQVKWTESVSLLDGNLSLAEDNEGKIWATFASAGQAKVVMSSPYHGAPSIALATFAALVYSPGSK